MTRLALGLAAMAAGTAAAQPVQIMRETNSFQCGNNNCELRFPVVPANRRLVLSSVSAQLPPGSPGVVLGGSSVRYFVAKNDAAGTFLTQPVNFSYGPGQEPVVSIFVPSQVPALPIGVTLVGELRPLP